MSVKTHDFVQNGANQNGRHRDASLFSVEAELLETKGRIEEFQAGGCGFFDLSALSGIEF